MATKPSLLGLPSDPSPKPAKKTPSKKQDKPKATPAPTPTAINLEEDCEAPAANIQDAVEMAERIVALEQSIEKDEAVLKIKKESLRKMSEEQLPELMSSMNLKTFSLSDGTKIDIKPFYSASIPTTNAIEKQKDPIEKEAMARRREAAFDWLRKHGGGSLIKSEVDVEFPKGEEKKALQFYRDCDKAGFKTSMEIGVHSQSLTAFVRETIEGGKVIPYDIFGIFVGKQAKFTKPKK